MTWTAADTWSAMLAQWWTFAPALLACDGDPAAQDRLLRERTGPVRPAHQRYHRKLRSLMALEKKGRETATAAALVDPPELVVTGSAERAVANHALRTVERRGSFAERRERRIDRALARSLER